MFTFLKHAGTLPGTCRKCVTACLSHQNVRTKALAGSMPGTVHSLMNAPAAMAAVVSAASEAAAAAAAAALGAAVDADGMRPAGRAWLPTWIMPRRNVPVVSTTLRQPRRSPAATPAAPQIAHSSLARVQNISSKHYAVLS